MISKVAQRVEAGGLDLIVVVCCCLLGPRLHDPVRRLCSPLALQVLKGVHLEGRHCEVLVQAAFVGEGGQVRTRNQLFQPTPFRFEHLPHLRQRRIRRKVELFFAVLRHELGLGARASQIL